MKVIKEFCDLRVDKKFIFDLIILIPNNFAVVEFHLFWNCPILSRLKRGCLTKPVNLLILYSSFKSEYISKKGTISSLLIVEIGIWRANTKILFEGFTVLFSIGAIGVASS